MQKYISANFKVFIDLEEIWGIRRLVQLSRRKITAYLKYYIRNVFIYVSSLPTNILWGY